MAAAAGRENVQAAQDVIEREEARAAQEAYNAATAARAEAASETTAAPSPGTFELLHRETRDVLATMLVFDGAKFELSKHLTPAFQTTHRFMLGSQVAPQSYAFSAVVADEKNFIMADVDSSFNLSSRGQYAVTAATLLKGQLQLTKKSDAYIGEVEYSTGDLSASVKLINPSLTDGSGVFVASYLQSLTRRLAVGAEVTLQRDPQARLGSGITFAGRYSGPNYILTGNVTTNGSAMLSYFQRVNEQITVASELEAMIMPGQRESVLTVGVKYDFRMSTVRAQLDTAGRLATVIEHRLNPGFAIVYSGELDHARTQSRFGVGLTLG